MIQIVINDTTISPHKEQEIVFNDLGDITWKYPLNELPQELVDGIIGNKPMKISFIEKTNNPLLTAFIPDEKNYLISGYSVVCNDTGEYKNQPKLILTLEYY